MASQAERPIQGRSGEKPGSGPEPIVPANGPSGPISRNNAIVFRVLDTISIRTLSDFTCSTNWRRDHCKLF